MASEDFTEKENTKTNFTELGRSGTLVSSDTIQNDYLTELIGVQGQDLYYKMLLGESTIRKLYHSVSNPIRSAVWDIEPTGDSPKELEQAALMREIIFNNVIGGWRAKLDEILTFPWNGHAVFEIVHKNRIDKTFGPYTGLANLAFRDQRTLDQWKFDGLGNLIYVHQIQSGDIEVDVNMPAETLLVFYNEKKGNDNGYPFCRMLYGNYKRKLLYKQLQAIGIEKGAIGVPKLTLPEGVEYGSSEYQAAVDQLTSYTQAESAHIILPNGYVLDLDQSNTFDPEKVQTAIKAENEEIAGSLVAMWLEMGIGGNSAVGSSTGISADFFRDGIEYLADKIADTINLTLIPNLMALNYGEDFEVLPRLTHAGIADEAGKELMEVVTGYTQAGVITPDEPLEDHIRKAHNLPKKAEGEMIDNQESQDETETPSTDNDNDSSNSSDNSPIEPNNKNVELSDKAPKTPRTLIIKQAEVIADDIREALQFSSAKYINDVMNRYKQLPKDKKQKATDKVIIGGASKLRKSLKSSLTTTATKSIAMARTEVPVKKDVELSNHERDMIRLSEKYNDLPEIKLNTFSKLPTYIQVLVAKQADLISEDSLADLKAKLDFSFSSIETKSADENVIRQAMEDNARKFQESGSIVLKGTNASSLMVNEGRDAFFFEPDVLEEIHSFTFMNIAPKSAVCRDLAGTTFYTNDAESLRYTPPLHHNCKSYLRANLKTSKGVDQLTISTLSPSAEAKKTITL